MQILVTRFHLLLLTVTLAITGVGLFRIPADFAFAAHWSGSTADWLWPRNATLVAAPVVEILLLAAFFVLGRALTKNHFAKIQHILDPALTLLLAVIAAVQLGFLFAGIGSDIDVIRIIGIVLGPMLMLLGVVLFEAERHTYAGLRMPWPIAADAAWRLVHRLSGAAAVLCGAGLLAIAWFDPGIGLTLAAYAGALLGLPLFAALVTFLMHRR